MTPTEVVTLARQRYNATSDDFFSDDELYTYLYMAQKELAEETLCIRNVYSTTTVASQQEYQKPTLCLSIKRITYNGQKILKILDREDDALTLFAQDTTATGTPQYYWEWGTSIELRPVPDDTLTLKIYCYDLPGAVSSTSSLDVPARYHAFLADFLNWQMAAKDKNLPVAEHYQAQWQKRVQDAKRYERKFLRGDAFSHVIDEETIPQTVIGAL